MGSLRRTGAARAVAAALAVLAAACGSASGRGPAASAPAGEVPAARHFETVRIASGFDRPTWVGAAPGDPDALWILEQPGRVVRMREGDRHVALDISGEVSTNTEAGLLGVAFHPGYAGNGRLFLHWSDLRGDTRVAEFRAGPDRTSIEPRPVRELLFVEQPEENHNGGQLAFGPDDRLYLGLGDGGGALDPRRTAQDPNVPLGKILAADVDADPPRWDPVLTGLRNPWRFSFDPALGEMWVADVGQDEFEEVNRVRLELDEPPKNLGWSAYEGPRRLAGRDLDRSGELIAPVWTYSHADGCSVVGGFVYGGAQLPDFVRRYLFGDFCTGTLWSLQGTADSGVTDVRRERAKVPQLTHIGTDGDGEIVFASAAGSLYRAGP